MLIVFTVLLGLLLHEAFGVYILSGNPEHVVLGDNVTVTLTCVVDDNYKIVSWSKDSTTVASIQNECDIDDARDTNYMYTCDLANKRYYLIIPPDAITDGIQNVVWRCLPVVGIGSITWSLTLSVPVTTVTLTPAGDYNVVDTIEGETQTFTCTSGSCRPAAWIQWYIGGQNVTNQAIPQPPQQDGDKFISSSSLVYTGRDVDHNKVIFCEAVNIEGRQKVKSTEKSLYIKYGPKEITLQPDQKSYTVSEMGSINTINCSASCRPDCRFVWKGPNMFEIQQFNLKFESVLRNQSGIYACLVSNIISSSRSQSISVIVNYKPSDLRLELHKSNTVNESESAIFQCNVDSNPASKITWTLTRSGRVLQTDHNVLQSNYTINRAKCTQTGTYMCQATNTFNGDMGMANNTIDFYVFCGTRTDDRVHEMPATIGVTNQEGLHITVFLIAYPKPVIQWVFTSGIANATIDSTDNTFNVFEHVTSLYIANMKLTDFGNYTIFAFNEIGDMYKKIFILIPQRTPDPPTNVSASCDISSMTVSWRSEFDGGDLQTFSVLWWKEFENETAYSDSVLDPGLHRYTDATIPVTADTRYIITVQATNTHGSVTSGEHVSCRTKQILASSRQDSNVLFAAGISGLVIGLLSIIFAVSFVVFCRFRQKKKDQMRSNNYIEFNTCRRCNPVVTDTYDSLETTNFGAHEGDENKADRIIATYEEIIPSENTTHNNQHQFNKPKDNIQKQERIYDNMKP